MKCCGIDIAGNSAILITVGRDEAGNLTLVRDACSRIELKDGTDQASVRAFFQAVHAFGNRDVILFAVRGRTTRGQFSGGGNGLKIEGLLQIALENEVVVKSPQTIAAYLRKSDLGDCPDLPKNQQRAFQTACCALDQAQ